MTKEELQEQLANLDITAVTMDGYDEAILGYSSRIEEDDDGLKTSVVYSYSKCINTLMTRDSMTQEEAIEFFEYNTVRALDYVNQCRPIIVVDMEV